MKPGIYHNIPFEEYKNGEGWKDCVHKSMFSHILKSGKALKYYLDHGEEEKDIMVFGNLVDCLLLEPEHFEERYVIIPELYQAKEGWKPWSWNSGYCKDWKKEHERISPDIKLVKKNELDNACLIVEEIKAHPEAQKWLSKAEIQISLYWIDPETDLPCKARMDAYNGQQIIDLKISHNVSPYAFQKTVNDFKYHAQGAFYHDGLLRAMGFEPAADPSMPFCFIAAEDKEPFDVCCYTLGPLSFEIGRIIYRQALDRYKEIMDTQDFSGYSNVAEEIEIPNYAINRYQYEGIVS